MEALRLRVKELPQALRDVRLGFGIEQALLDIPRLAAEGCADASACMLASDSWQVCALMVLLFCCSA